MLVLGIDTSGNYCQVTLMQDGVLREHYTHPVKRDHSGVLVTAIQQILKRHQQALKEVDLIAAVTGPGSFTGLRVGLATARGLALGLSIPCIGFSLFHILAACAYHCKKNDYDTLVILETHCDDFFIQRFDCQGNKVTAPEILNLQQISEIFNSIDLNVKFIGSAAEKIKNEFNLNVDIILPRLEDIGKNLCQLAISNKKRFESNIKENKKCTPLYLRELSFIQSNISL